MKSETLATRIGSDKARAGALFIERAALSNRFWAHSKPPNECPVLQLQLSSGIGHGSAGFCGCWSPFLLAKVVQPVRRLWPGPKECGCKFIALFAFSSVQLYAWLLCVHRQHCPSPAASPDHFQQHPQRH